jgi:hypothetical protein
VDYAVLAHEVSVVQDVNLLSLELFIMQADAHSPTQHKNDACALLALFDDVISWKVGFLF